MHAEQARQNRGGQVGCPSGERGVAGLAGLDPVLAEPAGQGLGCDGPCGRPAGEEGTGARVPGGGVEPGADEAGIAASGTGPASPSTASGLDACLVGTWKEVTQNATNTNYLGQQVTLIAPGPATYTFRPDGTGTEVFNNDDFSGTVNGTPWTDVVAGTTTYD